MRLQIVTAIDEERWRAFVMEHPHGNIFHTPEMFKVFEQAEGFRPELRAAVTEDGSIQALLLPVFVYLRRGVQLRATTRIVSHGSVLCAPGQEGMAALDVLLGGYCGEPGHKALFTELRNLADLSHLQPIFKAHGFHYEEHLNYLIDINHPPDLVLQKMGQRTRKHIRHAMREGKVQIEEVTDRALIPVVYELFGKSYKAAAVPLADISLFEAAFDVLHPLGMIKYFLARLEGTWVAATAELPFKDVIYGWYSGIDRAYGPMMAGELLMWHVLKWGAESGYKVYDFGGAGSPEESYAVRNFKAKFGGELVCFGRNRKMHAPRLATWCNLGYRLYRAVMSRRPASSEKDPHESR
jgi:serine/alanine adding enzyme